MTAVAKIERYDHKRNDVCFEMGENWYLIPVFILLDFSTEWERVEQPIYKQAAHELKYWLTHFPYDIDFLKTILRHHKKDLVSFIHYDSFINENDYNGFTGKEEQGSLF